MKKYKLLNAKGLLFSLGAATAVIAPVATLVACGTNSPKTLDKNVIDQKVHEQKMNFIHETMFKELGGWSLNEMDIFEQVFNSEESGIVNVSRLNRGGLNESLAQDQFIDKTFNVKGLPQHVVDVSPTSPEDQKKKAADDTVAAFKLDITKHDIISSKDEIKNANKKIVDFIAANPGEYAARVVEIKADNHRDANGLIASGEYQIQLFKKLETNAKIKTLFSLISDKNKMSVDLAQLAKTGGTYLMGQYGHGFGMHRGNGFDEFGTTVTQKGDYGDRSNEDSLKSWTAFGPTSDISVSDADLNSVAGLTVTQHLEEDKKTHIFTLVSTASTANTIATHYLPLPVLNSFSNAQFDVNKIVDILTSKLNFSYYYNFLKGLDVNLLNSAGSAKRHVIDIAGLLPEMAKVSDLLHDNQFMNELLAFIKTEDPNLSFSTFQLALENMENNKLQSPDAFGPKTYELMHFTERFFEHTKNFLLNNPAWSTKAIQVKDADTFYNLQKEEADYKQYLVDHKTTLDALKLQSTSDKTLTKTEIEYYELNITNAKEIQDAATKLGANATKAEILAEAKKNLNPLANLQVAIDRLWKDQGKFIFKPTSISDATLQAALNKTSISYTTTGDSIALLKAEIVKLIPSGQQFLNGSNIVNATGPWLRNQNITTKSFDADKITVEIKFDTKSADGAIHHNSQILTFYRHA